MKLEKKVLKTGSICSFLVVLFAYLYKRNADSVLQMQSRLDSVLKAMEHAENEVIDVIRPKVAVGYGSCQDLFVRAKDLFRNETPPANPQHYNYISSLNELLEMFAYFYQYGAAAERFVYNETLFEDVVKTARALPGARKALGGNAPVMARRFLLEGSQVLLASEISKGLKESFPGDILITGDVIAKPDIHLIVEYRKSETWGRYQSPRANRFILHSDVHNPMVNSLENFDAVLREFKPQLLVVSGLQMMDNFPFPQGVRRKRLTAIRDQMKSLPHSTRIHFEMASFSDIDLMKELAQLVIPNADSIGMNEQELPNLHSLIRFGNVSVVSESNPRVANVLDQMREVFRAIRSMEDASRKLTRIHVHTLAYQVILVVRGSPWKNAKVAAAKASLTAHRHVCQTSKINTKNAALIMDDSFSTSQSTGSDRVNFNSADPVACWQETLDEVQVELCLAPVLVCTRVHQTAGAGDNISSAGIVVQV